MILTREASTSTRTMTNKCKESKDVAKAADVGMTTKAPEVVEVAKVEVAKVDLNKGVVGVVRMGHKLEVTVISEQITPRLLKKTAMLSSCSIT